MTIGIVLLVVCVGSMVILWAGFGGVEISGPLTVGLISVVIGILGLCNFEHFDVRFGVSLAFLLIGGAIFFSSIRKKGSMKEFSAAVCVAIALISGIYGVLNIS
jgi:hypothetical protein